MNKHNIDREEIWNRITSDERMPKAPNKSRRLVWFTPIILLGILALALWFKNSESTTIIIAHQNSETKSIINTDIRKSEKTNDNNISDKDKNTNQSNNSSVTKTSTGQSEKNNVESNTTSKNISTQKTKSPVSQSNIATKEPSKQSKTKTSRAKESTLIAEHTISKSKETKLFAKTEEPNTNPIHKMDTKQKISSQEEVEDIANTSTMFDKDYDAIKSHTWTAHKLEILSFYPLHYTSLAPLTAKTESTTTTRYETHNKKSWEIYLHGGIGKSSSQSKTIDSLTNIYLDSFNMYHSSYIAELGIKKRFNKWWVGMGVGVSLHQYRGHLTYSDISYIMQADNSMLKLRDITKHTLYQKYGSINTHLQLGYEWNLGWMSVSPFAGVNYKLSNLAYGSIMDNSRQITKINSENVRPMQKLSYSYGIELQKSLNSNWAAKLRWQGKSKTTFDYPSKYIVETRAMYISLGVGYCF